MSSRQGNPNPPAGISAPSVAWAQANCTVTDYDYGNNNIEHYYSCIQWGVGGGKFRCTWRQWNNGPLTFHDCNQIWRPYYHEVHGGGEGPQSYGVEPPYVPMSQRLRLRARLSNPGRNETSRRWTHGLARVRR